MVSPPGPAPPSTADPPALAATPRRSARRIWAVTWVGVIVVLLAVAGVAAWGISTSTVAPPTPPPPGWMTFHQAAPVAQQVADSLIVGPWSLSFAAGIAADGPWSPAIGGTFGATPPCAGRLSGISLFTYWNDSEYPTSHASTVFSSGTAPLWTFGFIDATGDVAVISVVNGSGAYNGLWTAGSGCAAPLEPQYRPGFSPTTVADSSSVAATVRGLPSGPLTPRVGSGGAFDPEDPGTAFEMYSIGDWTYGTVGVDPNVASTAHLPTWWNIWGRCGLAGDSGWSPSVALSFNATSAGWTGTTIDSPSYCQSVGAVGSLGSPSVGVPPGPPGNFETWSVRLTASTSSVPAPTGWNRLTTGSLTPALWTNGSSGAPFTTPVTSGAAVCGVGTGTLSDCTVSPSGWYAVLTDAQGNWLDSFPSVVGGSNWTRANVTVTTGDAMEILLPAEPPSVKLFELEYPGWNDPVAAGYLDL
jgi:hypothetical protein